MVCEAGTWGSAQSRENGSAVANRSDAASAPDAFEAWEQLLSLRPEGLLVLGGEDVRSHSRSELALRFYRFIESRGHLPPKLIFSGGGRRMLKRAGIPEAAEMAGYCLARGLPCTHILLETEASNTGENLTFGLALAQAQGLERIVIVTDAYHARRCRRLLRHLVGNRPVHLLLSNCSGSHRLRCRELLAYWLQRLAWSCCRVRGYPTRPT